MNRQRFPRENRIASQSGYVVLLVTFMLVVITGMAALALDIGQGFVQQRNILVAADAASVGGVKFLPTNQSNITTAVNALALANGVPSSDVTEARCGTWNAATTTFTAGNSSCSSANAVRVKTKKSVASLFGRVMGIQSLLPRVTSVAAHIAPGFCIRPFAIEEDVVEGVSIGSTFSLSQSPSNWGKLDSPNGFSVDMLSGACDTDYLIGQSVGSTTGVSGIKTTFASLLTANANLGMYIALTETIPNGNHSTVIEQFAKVDFLSQSGSGNNWTGTFRLVELNSTPPGTSTDKITLVQ